MGALLACSVALFGTCRQPSESVVREEPAPAPIDIPALGLRLIAPPAGFEVVANDTQAFVLEPEDRNRGGRIAIVDLSPNEGQNIPAAVDAHQQSIEDLEGGQAQGRQELVSQLGTTFISRIGFTEDGAPIEETVVFALHPAGGRMMTITYRYPAGDDSNERAQELLEVVGSIELPTVG